MKTLLGIFKVPDLTKKLMVTLGLLIVYRMGTFITIPGVDPEAVNRLFEHLKDESGVGRVMGMADMFSGGAIANAAVFSLGIMPYITASILFQILTTVFPALKKLSQDGESGRKKIDQYTRYATLGLCIFQSAIICKALQTPMGENIVLVPNPGFLQFIFIGMVCLTTGTMIVMWLGEMITEFGMGNGISIIIMAGILARLPSSLDTFIAQVNDPNSGLNYLTVVFLLAFFVGVVIAIIYTTLGQRRIPIQQSRRAAGAGVYGGQKQYLPLRVNMAGVIPIIFAQSLMMFPAVLAKVPGLELIGRYLSPGTVTYTVFYLFLIVFFCFFYTAMIFSPTEMSENMKQGGTFVPGVRPGQETKVFFETLLTRITVIGSGIIAAVAVIPQFLAGSFNISYSLAGIFGGTGLLIVVGVGLDLIQKIDGELLTHNFGGMLEKGQQRQSSNV